MQPQDFKQQSSVVVLRRIYLDAISSRFEGNSKSSNYCAAKLISYFDHWRKWKTKAFSDEWVYMPLRQIYDDLMGEHSLHVIRESIGLLEGIGILSRRNGSNGQDKTWYYRINLDALEELLPDGENKFNVNFIEAFDKLCADHAPEKTSDLKELSYDAFLRSDYWKTTRDYVVSTRRQCQKCGSTKRLQVHHKTYANIGNEHQNLKDLQLLCGRCHIEAHKFIGI